jgi:hypothetical protein
MHRPYTLRALAAAATLIAGLGGGALVGGLTVSTTPAGAQTGAPPQHYLCYKATAKAGFKVPKGIRLINSLAPNGFVPTFGPANLHCNPTVKDVPGAQYEITSPTWHFLGWELTTKQPSARVTATNQFGTAKLVATSPTELLVPSWKSLTGPPNESTNTPPGEDHYTCYPVTYAKGSAQYSAPSPVMVQDEFASGLVTVTVGVPKLLCLPTEKILPTGATSPINNPNLNYVCFQVSKTPILSPVYDQNQFGQGPVTIKATKTLCLPTTLGSATG